MFDVVVVGQIGRDLVLAVDHLPGGGASVPVSTRREVLGGAVNQAVGARQLGCRVALVGVLGDDDAGRSMFDQARSDGLDTTAVRRRPGGTTALFVDLVEADGTNHLLEHVPPSMQLAVSDVHAAWSVLSTARAVLVQLAQPGSAVLEAIRIAARHDARVVLDGTNEDPVVVREAAAMAHTVRADAAEAAALVGRDLQSVQDVVGAAEEILTWGPSIVALAVAGTGNVVAWPEGHAVIPLLGGDPIDATGGGDAFVAGLVVAMLRGHDAHTGAWWASAASALTVNRLGGRPALDIERLTTLATSSREQYAVSGDDSWNAVPSSDIAREAAQHVHDVHESETRTTRYRVVTSTGVVRGDVFGAPNDTAALEILRSRLRAGNLPLAPFRLVADDGRVVGSWQHAHDVRGV